MSPHRGGETTKRLDRIASETFGALHRDSISNPTEVRAILERAAQEGSVLNAGIDRTARILHVDLNALLLAVTNISLHANSQLFFSLELAGTQYFFACSAVSAVGARTLRATIPRSVYRAERRDLGRSHADPRRVMIQSGTPSRWSEVEVMDRTRHGIGIRMPQALAESLPLEIELRVGHEGEPAFGRVRHRTADSTRPGWLKVGLSVSSVPTSELLNVDRRDQILGRGPTVRETMQLARAGVSALALKAGFAINRRRHRVHVVEYENERGESIRAIENRWGAHSNGVGVIIPPAWGRTKETMLPLAMTLVESFRRLGEPIRVIRFDGTNRRGESHIDQDCRQPGDEYLRFTFSQAARDISATVDYLLSDQARAPRKIILVTFSLAAVEARHALARDHRVSGWVSIVGMADLHSALRTISGGIDFGSGLLQGMKFGRHELAGVVADMDYTGLDAIENGIGFLEDARREMAHIEIPITWIHGRHDAWMDLNRVIEIMSCGPTETRRIIEVPTGHQLRSGHKALATFQLIAEEVSEMALGERKSGVLPRVTRVAAARAAELARIPLAQPDVRAFWADYLLGRSRIVGMELLTATAAYRNFMEAQVRMLQLAEGQRVADLGAGTGEFSVGLRGGLGPKRAKVIEVDFVRDALIRARSRRDPTQEQCEVLTTQCVGNLDLRRGMAIPLASGSINAVIASLLISYVESPERLLREIYRVLMPGGRVVLSSMVQDADATMLFHDGLLEYATPEARTLLGRAVDSSFDSLVRDFLNDGSRLLDLEESGRFRFWEESELRFAVANAGFVEVQAGQGFGDPPQAVIVSARRP